MNEQLNMEKKEYKMTPTWFIVLDIILVALIPIIIIVVYFGLAISLLFNIGKAVESEVQYGEIEIIDDDNEEILYDYYDNLYDEDVNYDYPETFYDNEETTLYDYYETFHGDEEDETTLYDYYEMFHNDNE